MSETPLDRAQRVLRRSACAIAIIADMDPLALYRETHGSSEEAYQRQYWLWLARTAFDVPEADIARALSAYRSEGRPAKHHDSIAHACHRVEDDVAGNPRLAEALEAYGEALVELCALGDRLRVAIERNRPLRERRLEVERKERKQAALEKARRAVRT